MFRQTLDDDSAYKSLDKSNIYSSLQKLSRQFDTGWHDAHFLNLPFDLDKIKNIVVAGMGGSNLAGKILHSLSPYYLKIPIEVQANYRLPSYAGKNTLVFLSSYSGNTQEIISCAADAKNKSCKIICLTTGGQLEKIAKEEKWPTVIFDDSLNVSKIPRLGLFSSLGAMLAFAARLNPDQKDLDQKQLSLIISKSLDSVQRDLDTSSNPAKSLAMKLRHTGIVFVAANHLTGVGDSIKNYVNESAKTYSSFLTIPDVNHHYLDGLVYPVTLKDNLTFILLNSALYPQAIQRRFEVTKEVLIKQKYSVTIIKPESTTPPGQALESMVFFTLFSYYLSIVNKVDPGTNPWVDYFKNHL